MRPFQFASNPIVIFGSGKLARLTDLTHHWKGTPVVVTGGTSFQNSKHFDRLLQLIGPFHLIAIPHEPSVSCIDQAVENLRGIEPAGIIAIGGGAAMDAGKAIAAMYCEQKSVLTLLEGVGTTPPTGQRLPLICVPTTAGTGSEATKNAVITQPGINGFKKSLRHQNYIPDVALVDPELHLSCPSSVTAASGMDAFTQLLESYLSTQANDMTDAMALSGLQKIKSNLPAVMTNGQDLEARANMAYAALLSGMTLANAGLGTVHGFASSIGGTLQIPHGVVCGTLMGNCNRKTFEIAQQQQLSIPLHKYRVASSLFGCATVPHFLDLIDQWTCDFNLPKLGDYGFTAEMVPKVASETGNKNNPVVLETPELEMILIDRI